MSWIVDADGAIDVRTLCGPIPLATAAHCPAPASAQRSLDPYDVEHAGGANVGMRNQHPIPSLCVRCRAMVRNAMVCRRVIFVLSNSGAMEWTPFAGHARFVSTRARANDAVDGSRRRRSGYEDIQQEMCPTG